MSDTYLSAIDSELDVISYEWLNVQHPKLCAVIETAVIEGRKKPTDIRRHILSKYQRNELSLRCEQAARYIMVNNGV